MFKPRPSTFLAEFANTQLHSARAHAITDRVNGEGLGSEATLAEFAHTQLHSARARAITDRVNGEGLGSEATPALCG